MRKISFILLMIVFSNLFAASIGTEESYSNSSSFNQQKNIEKSKSKNIEKSKSLEKGIEKNRNKSFSKSKTFEKSYSKENSISFNKNFTIKSTISVYETQLMPEIDFLINRVLKDLVRTDKAFINDLVIKRYEIPDNLTTIPVLAQYPSLSNGAMLIGNIQRKLIVWLANYFKNNVVLYFSNYLKGYQFVVGATAGLSNLFDCSPNSVIAYQPMLAQRGLCDYTVGANYWIILNGDIQGRIEASFAGSLLTPIFIRSPKYNLFLSFDPTKNIFEVVYKNRRIVYLSPNEILHFYGDLVFDENYLNNNIVVVDQKIGADGLYLNVPNSNKEFDSYFKKLMKLYLEAFKHLQGGTYSIEEAKFLIREYIYKKVFHKNDFLQKYINDPTDFWRPRKQDLLSYPQVMTSYNDIVFDKKDGIILNRKVSISIEKSSSIDKKFTKLLRTQSNTAFVKKITKTISTFERENKQELARLVKALAVKFASSKNFASKQDLINKASNSSDVLKTLLDLVK